MFLKPPSPIPPRRALIVSIDTEEDHWQPRRVNVQVTNVRRVRSFHHFLCGLGLKPTYFITYHVARAPWAAEWFREWIADSSAEVGAHLHPWNNPPFDFAEPSDFTILRSYSRDAQSAKLQELTDAIEQDVGLRPVSFRAGRFALGADTVGALHACGYSTDSSATPFFDWTAHGNGVNWIGAPLRLYRISGSSDPKHPVDDGPIIEVPLSSGFTRFGPNHWPLVAKLLSSRLTRVALLPPLAARTRFVRRSILSPESAPLHDMIAVATQLLNNGIGHLHMFLHSSSLVPGLTPFNATQADVDRMHRVIEQFVEAMSTQFDVVPRTISEVAEEFRSTT